MLDPVDVVKVEVSRVMAVMLKRGPFFPSSAMIARPTFPPACSSC
jgi:hypothetical protein